MRLVECEESGLGEQHLGVWVGGRSRLRVVARVYVCMSFCCGWGCDVSPVVGGAVSLSAPGLSQTAKSKANVPR